MDRGFCPYSYDIDNMKDSELLVYIKDNKSNFTRVLRTHHNTLYNKINDNYLGKEFSEKLYRHLNRKDNY